MTSRIVSDESSSSDDDYYDNFRTYKAAKAKAAKALRKPKEPNESNCMDAPVNATSLQPTTAADSSLVELVDVDELENLPSPICSTNMDYRLVSPSAVGASVVDLSIDETPLPNKTKPFANSCTINISSKGQTKVFCCDMDEPIRFLIEDFAERTNADPERINLYTKQYKRCNPKETPRMLGFAGDGSLVELDAFEDLEQSELKFIKLKYQMKGQKPQIARVLPDSNFGSLKELFCSEHRLNSAGITFILDSERIADGDTPESLGLEDGDCIDVYTI